MPQRIRAMRRGAEKCRWRRNAPEREREIEKKERERVRTALLAEEDELELAQRVVHVCRAHCEGVCWVRAGEGEKGTAKGERERERREGERKLRKQRPLVSFR